MRKPTNTMKLKSTAVLFVGLAITLFTADLWAQRCDGLSIPACQRTPGCYVNNGPSCDGTIWSPGGGQGSCRGLSIPACQRTPGCFVNNGPSCEGRGFPSPGTVIELEN